MTIQNIEPCGEADVYREEILDHSRHPRNKKIMIDATFKSKRRNMSCGDSMEMFIKMDEDGRVTQLTFDGIGCAISQAVASMLTEKVLGKTLTEITAMGQKDIFALLGTEVGPARIRCAMLALDTLKKGIEEYQK
jgi:nitrogen fixation NifU-like protein